MPKIVTTEVISNSKEVIAAMHEQVAAGLKAIGVTAEGYAKKGCPVDSGRLRNSIAWAIKGEHGNSDEPMKPGDDKPKAEPEEKSVYIGTNVEYAEGQEYGEYKHKVGGAHFLRNAMSAHGDHYKAIMEAALKK